MSLLLSGDLRLRHQLPADAEADAYIAAVEAADGQALEPGVKFAIKNFVLCCKQDGIWDAIKASCILAGARTLNGALVPLVGTAPTNVSNFIVSGDYTRNLGLAGGFGNKRLDSNYNNNTPPQDNRHLSAYATTQNSPSIGGRSTVNAGPSHIFGSVRLSSSTTGNIPNPPNRGGFYGASRQSPATFTIRGNGATSSVSATSATPDDVTLRVFAYQAGAGPVYEYSQRIAFYSIGESLDLALLDARVTDLINAIGAAIP